MICVVPFLIIPWTLLEKSIWAMLISVKTDRIIKKRSCLGYEGKIVRADILYDVLAAYLNEENHGEIFALEKEEYLDRITLEPDAYIQWLSSKRDPDEFQMLTRLRLCDMSAQLAEEIYDAFSHEQRARLLRPDFDPRPVAKSGG